MSNINISHKHGQDKHTACDIAESMIDELAQNYGLTINSNGEGHIEFNGSGINGTVEIDHECVNISAQLGFLMAAMKPAISNAIESKLHEKFAL